MDGITLVRRSVTDCSSETNGTANTLRGLWGGETGDVRAAGDHAALEVAAPRPCWPLATA